MATLLVLFQYPFIYSSCCVDEIAAEHVAADAIIHFGHACLSFTKRFPVLYIFGRAPIDVPNVVSTFKECLPDVTRPVIIYYEVMFQHAISKLSTFFLCIFFLPFVSLNVAVYNSTF